MQVQSAASHERLTLSGVLNFDSNRMVRVHSRFPGEVVSIGNCRAPSRITRRHRDASAARGRPVTKGQLLAVIWSKEVGEKEERPGQRPVVEISALGPALEAQGAGKPGDRRQAGSRSRTRPGTRHHRSRSPRTHAPLVAADRSGNQRRPRRGRKNPPRRLASDMEVDRSWAEVEVRCPFDGTVLEKNVVAGDIVDTSLDLFQDCRFERCWP